jgi:hypothetical protein
MSNPLPAPAPPIDWPALREYVRIHTPIPKPFVIWMDGRV